MTNKERAIFIKIKSVIFKNIKDLPFYFFLFGSRVNWKAKERSDYDIWFISKNWEKLSPLILSNIQDWFDNIPALIDLIDFSEVSENFKSEVMIGCTLECKKIVWINKID